MIGTKGRYYKVETAMPRYPGFVTIRTHLTQQEAISTAKALARKNASVRVIVTEVVEEIVWANDTALVAAGEAI